MFHNFSVFYAGVLELADEADSKSAACEGVWVRVPPPAPETKEGDLSKKISLVKNDKAYFFISFSFSKTPRAGKRKISDFFKISKRKSYLKSAMLPTVALMQR